ncbi:MAG: fasciclin domain-containing protein [Planctomycetota bacterium]
MTRYAIPAAVLAAAALWFVGCTEKEVKAERPEPEELVEPEGPADVFTTLVRGGRCSTLVEALEKSGLSETLRGPGPFTLFAPTDEAFAALPEGRLDYLMENPEELKALLLRHIAPAKIPSSEVTWSNTIRTIAGQKLVVIVEEGIERIDGAVVLERDMMATNGVIHVIDAVLEGPEAP